MPISKTQMYWREGEREAGTPRVAERGSHQSPQHKEAEARARTYTSTHAGALASSYRRCLVRSRLLHNGCCTSLTPLVLFKKQCPKVALHPQEQTLTFVPRAVRDGANIRGTTTGCLFWASPLVPVSHCDVLSSLFSFLLFSLGGGGERRIVTWTNRLLILTQLKSIQTPTQCGLWSADG